MHSTFRYFIFLTCPPNIMAGFDIMVDVAFCIDLALTFFTGYRPQRSISVEYRHKKIAMRYLKGWFLLDLAAILPFNDIARAMATGKKQSRIRPHSTSGNEENKQYEW